MKLQHILSTLILASLAFFSCKKDNDILLENAKHSPEAELALQNLTSVEERNFFDMDFFSQANPYLLPVVKERSGGDEDSLITSVFDFLLLQNAEVPFAQAMVDAWGYPIWNRSEILRDTNDTNAAVITPFAKTNEDYIRAFMVAIPLGWSGEWHMLYGAKPEIDLIVTDSVPADSAQILGFYVLQTLKFNEDLFGKKMYPSYLEWVWDNLEATDTIDGFNSNDEINSRSFEVTYTSSYWAPCEDKLTHEEIEVRGADCEFTGVVHSYVNCSGGGAGGISTPPIGSTTSGGNSTGGTSQPTDQQIIDAYHVEICEEYQDAWNEGEPAPENWTDMQEDKCRAFYYLQGIFLGISEMAWLTQNSDILNEIWDWIEVNGEFDATESQAFQQYVELKKDERTSLSWADFLKLYKLVVNELQPQLELNQIQVDYLLSNSELADVIKSFLNEKNKDEASKKASRVILNLVKNNWLLGPYPESQREQINSMYEFPDPEMLSEYLVWCFLLLSEWQQAHPGETCDFWCHTTIGLEAYWKTYTGIVHTALDICGLIPAGGEPCDLVNGVLYAIEGDGVNATLSFAATIPVAGWAATGYKYVKIGVNTAAGFKKLKITKVGSLFEFSHYSSFRQLLGVTDPTKHAHHILSWNKRTDVLVQRAAQADAPPFHMNNPNGNGIAIDSWRNQPNHSAYDSKIQDSLDDILENLETSYGPINNIDPNIVSQALKDFQDYLRTQITNHPTLHLNDVPISYP